MIIIRDGTNATAYVTIHKDYAEVEIGFIQRFTRSFAHQIEEVLRQEGVASAVLNTGPVINPELAIKLGMHAQKGTQFFRGTVRIIQGGRYPIFQIHWDAVS